MKQAQKLKHYYKIALEDAQALVDAGLTTPRKVKADKVKVGKVLSKAKADKVKAR